MEKTAEGVSRFENAQVKALGEEEYLALQAKLATQEAEAAAAVFAKKMISSIPLAA